MQATAVTVTVVECRINPAKRNRPTKDDASLPVVSDGSTRHNDDDDDADAGISGTAAGVRSLVPAGTVTTTACVYCCRVPACRQRTALQDLERPDRCTEIIRRFVHFICCPKERFVYRTTASGGCGTAAVLHGLHHHHHHHHHHHRHF